MATLGVKDQPHPGGKALYFSQDGVTQLSNLRGAVTLLSTGGGTRFLREGVEEGQD